MGPRFDEAVRGALDHAAELAARRKHETIDLEHLFRALLHSGLVRQALERMSVSLGELEARTDATLDARVGVAGYRDGSVPNASARLTRALDRARPVGLFKLRRSVGIEQLWPALLAEPSIAQLVFDARLGALRMSTIVEHAKLVAAARSHRAVRVEHALLAISDTEWFGGALDRVGSKARFLDAIEDALENDQAVEVSAGLVVTVDLEAFARRAAAMGSSTPEGVHFVAQVLRSPLSKALFELAETSPYELLRAVAHPDQGAGLALSTNTGACEVIFHNDDFTTMEFVLETLQQVFDLEQREAMLRMLEVHQAGESAVGVFASEDAKRRVEEAMVRARDAVMPLRISLRAAALR